jgi:uncharacterized membrane protein YgcG
MTASPSFDVVLPYQFSNLIFVFVTTCTLLWGMVALKRFYRMLRVRSAVLTERLIQIRGLGSFLSFFDGATRMHLDAVVHTRQSMPPVSMQPLSLLATVHSLRVGRNPNSNSNSSSSGSGSGSSSGSRFGGTGDLPQLRLDLSVQVRHTPLCLY